MKMGSCGGFRERWYRSRERGGGRHAVPWPRGHTQGLRTGNSVCGKRQGHFPHLSEPELKPRAIRGGDTANRRELGWRAPRAAPGRPHPRPAAPGATRARRARSADQTFYFPVTNYQSARANSHAQLTVFVVVVLFALFLPFLPGGRRCVLGNHDALLNT